MMEYLGTPAMPWQEWAADVIGEVTPEGLPRWPMVVISVPRQSGKTTLLLAACIHRMMTGRRKKVWSTAQTGQKARKKWLEQVEIMESEVFPLRSLFKAKKAAGSEQLTFTRLNSTFSPHPPNEESLHGEQSDLNFIDEAWVFDDAEAQALMQAIVPTQTTRRGAQTIVVSTMGTARSTWFHGLVDKAKQPSSGIALLEWGIDPGDDPTDLGLVASHHPAFGHTMDMAALERAAKQLVPMEFARAYGNLRTGARDRFIPLTAWQSAESTVPIPDTCLVVFGAAVDYQRTETAIAACAVVDGVPTIEMIDVRPGTGWATDRLIELRERHDTPPPVVDPIGPSGPLFDQLKQRGHEPPAFNVRALTSSCADLLDRITRTDSDGLAAPEVRIRPHQALDLAAELAEQRRVGDAWAWERRRAAGSIAALEAATLALYGALHRPAPPIKPFIY
ncbi:terminase large subunit domain-containing protein [Corynebacterium mastitidis]|uniref:terminase large subunit domain-containing protein n=1 Tax=Corynebacterium mastitidis TaxID=161890 RepID=UPI0003A232E1|nr:terminase family protein [Corynebacterium mastitidis]